MEKGQKKWQLDPGIAKASIVRAQYRCEVSADHQTFTSRTTNQNYVEAHHLIPMKFQDEFVHSLDRKTNIFSLCPNCHRLLHHATLEEKEALLRRFFGARKDALQGDGVVMSLSKLIECYG